MTGEFSAYCNKYYQLSELHSKREERLKNLLDVAPLYCGQTGLSEVDAIISYYRKVQAAKAKIERTLADVKKAARTILMILRHFEIPPDTVLIGEIPGELEYKVWADEDDAVFISKTKDIAPGPIGSNTIVIRFWKEDEGEDEDW